MSDGHRIHLNGQTRVLRFRSKDIIAAQAVLPGNKSLLQALAFDRDMSAVCVGAAFALRHEHEGKNNKAPGPATIADWLDREQGKFRELEMCVLRAAEDHYVAMDRLSRGDLTGEAQPATSTTPSPSTSSSTASPGDGGSTPNSSND
jgi:hypothetical protein